MLLQLYSSEVHSQAVLCSNLLVVCGKLKDYKVVVLLSSCRCVGKKKESKAVFLSTGSRCSQDGMFDCLFLLVFSLKSMLRKHLTVPEVVLAIFKASAIFIALL